MNIRCPGCSNTLSAGGHAGVHCPYCRTVINPGGSSGSFPLNAGASRTRARGRSHGSSLQMIVVACILLILVGGGVIVGLTVVRQAGHRTDDAGPQQPLAVIKAQEVLARELPYKDLTFEDNPKVHKVQDNEWKIESHLVHRASTGKLVKMTYSARVWLEGKDNWRVEVLEVGGQRPRFASNVPFTKPKGSDDPQPFTPTPEREEHTVSRAMHTLGGLVNESAALRSTLVVWLFDTSPSAGSWREEVTRNFETVYAALRKHGASKSPANKAAAKTPNGTDAQAKEAAVKETPAKDTATAEAKLKIAVVTFDDVVKVLTDRPVADEAALREVMGKIAEGQGGHERPFAALQTALDKFGDFTLQGGRLQFVVVTDEAGDDEEKPIDNAVAGLKKSGAQVYVIGKEAPWAQIAWPTSSGGPVGADPLHHGPESLLPERINLQFWERGFREELIPSPSGFGPYQLSRVCQQTGGAFFIGDDGAWSGGFGSREGGGFDRKARERYAPKYMSADEYRKFLETNAAARALHEAAKTPSFELPQLLALDFLAGDEARMKQALDRAQQPVARVEPKLIALYDTLKAGVSDRPKLAEPRLQAGFDLAFGRASAVMSRVGGCNAMLAALKGGRRFKDASSTTWVLQPSDQTGAGSTYERYLKDAQTYLDRVVKEHPGTPWAKEAQRELGSKMGWEWTER